MTRIRPRLPLLAAILAFASCSDGSGPAAPTATRLAFTTEPANAVADTAMAANIRVSVLDQGGAVLATATPAVTLALGENPGSATLAGATTVTAVAGVATFPGILLDRVGAGYTLVATSPGLTPDTSATFAVTLSLNDADGDGYSPNAGDCDDFTPAIHPGATDFPDAAYIDTNCDGTDGERANAAFVATTGVDGPTCGTEASPCATVQQGIDRAVALGRRDVYVVAGHYAGGAFTLADGVNVFGGFDPQYRRNPANVATITGRSDFPVDAGTQSLVVFASSLTLPTVVADLTLSGTDAASRFGGGQGKSSYVIVARSIPAGVLTIARNVIVARNGLSGALGANGPNAATLSGVGLAGGAGGGADEFTTTCNNTSRGLGGAGGAIGGTGGTVSTVPGAGGNGGTMDTDCNPFALNTTARPGANGQQAAHLGLVPSRGHGGVGGTGGDLCGLPQDGEPGTITNGAAGTGAGAGGRIIGGFWAARDGGDGGLGDNGGGGGGGGGSGGCDIGTDSYGAGGGGGGAGGRLALGGGVSGKGGGGSFGIYLLDASPTIQGNTITRGGGANGGNGGIGGQGQSGGLGGPGGLAAGESRAGGRGGNGGHGGHGGGGGGGAGGISFGIYQVGISAPTLSGNTVTGGSAGQGGQGGASAPNAPPAERDGNAAQGGAPGTLGTVGTCAAAGAC